jgi:hypothetical protein
VGRNFFSSVFLGITESAYTTLPKAMSRRARALARSVYAVLSDVLNNFSILIPNYSESFNCFGLSSNNVNRMYPS